MYSGKTKSTCRHYLNPALRSISVQDLKPLGKHSLVPLMHHKSECLGSMIQNIATSIFMPYNVGVLKV